MSNIWCDIIKDLLPLYYDEVCSSQSRKIVEEHLAGCISCQRDFKK
ncbi:zf-HC2 domain-containing protein [Clostridium aestuarii]|uniref:Zf-HC2 domain-containing protein n=1 Tax=Clostridium aestuarii TaxID=338193 RepID=A0ABT4D007_9CLOT|nr:zf-HC2 domain-containing protein [Clostridium aestuarii]MCY6484566.1 zf-HC2 domain-containing protein [Clostridium aestuarii]